MTNAYDLFIWPLQEELKKLLASLTEANELAARLRERSIEMIRMVGQDMDQLRSGHPWTQGPESSRPTSKPEAASTNLWYNDTTAFEQKGNCLYRQ